MPGPVLFCYDGSEGSRAAMAAAAELVARPASAVVLTIWQPAAVLLAKAGGFGGGYLSNEQQVDGEQEQLARDAAEEGVERARTLDYDASSRVERATARRGSALAATAIQTGQLVDKPHHKASHDALTGLLNRVGFRRHIDRVLNEVHSGGGQVGLLFVDFDEFKQVNDAYGHEAGDELIRKAAFRLEAITRGRDEVARLGGDEFAIVLGQVHGDDQVRAAEERVRAAFVEPFLLGDLTISIGASVGGGLWPEHGRTVQELIRHADAAMYEDRAKGRRPPVAV